MKPIPRDSGSFPDIRGAGQLYVDKTACLHRLVTSRDGKCFFLARPRRFGKSLMITTLKEIFNGRRDLFEGLDIAATDYGWKVHPVLHFDFGDPAVRTSIEDFRSSFRSHVERVLASVGCGYDPSLTPGMNFGEAVDELARRDPKSLPVVLIDEYDDPVAKVLDRIEFAEAVRDELSQFYGQLKPRTDRLRFLMITGVSKFTKMSVFSALSNLIDLSFDDDYATMLGYTEADLDRYFEEPMRAQAAKMGLSYEAYRAELRRMYNGYRFWKLEGEKVYNPVSINLDLARTGPEFEFYWAKTGRASTLMNLIKRGDMLAVDPERVAGVTDDDFDVSDLRSLRAVPMLYQTGYLTIAEYGDGIFSLCVPDEEVRRDLAKLQASLLADKDVAWAASLGAKLRICDWNGFFIGLKSLYAGLVYGSTEGAVHEASFARNLKVLLQSQGFRTIQEFAQADGRSDLVADHACGTYVFELKVDRPAAVAMGQAQAKAYAAPFVAPGKPVWLVGLAFDRESRTFVDGVAEAVAPGRAPGQ